MIGELHKIVENKFSKILLLFIKLFIYLNHSKEHHGVHDDPEYAEYNRRPQDNAGNGCKV